MKLQATPAARFALALCAFFLSIAAATQAYAAAIIIDNFSGTKQAGPRAFTASQGGGMGTAPTFVESGGWGTITVTPVNSIVTGTLTYTPPAQLDLTGGGTNNQFLMEYVGVTTDNPTGFTQVFNLQITINTLNGTKQYSGIGIGEGQVNQALPFSSFTGNGNLAKVTSIVLSFNSASNTHDGSVTIDRIWASPLAGAVPTAPGASFVAGRPRRRAPVLSTGR
jgi:hypothetical protein